MCSVALVFGFRCNLHTTPLKHSKMSGPVNAAGWYRSTKHKLKNATLASVISEDIHNIEHYKTRYPNAGPAKLLYGSCRARNGNDQLFFRASNMPHTKRIVEDKFTVFAAKDSESMIATHGFGAVLPPMYIGGDYEGQFRDPTTGDWFRTEFDIGAQEEECRTLGELKTFPSPPKKLGGNIRTTVDNADMWPTEVLAAFRTYAICTIEVHTNPTCEGHEDIGNREEFERFLESIQAQFEDMIVREDAVIAGIFVDDVPTLYHLPYNFYKKHNPSSSFFAFPVSPYGITELEEALDFEFLYTETSMHGRVKISEEDVYFVVPEKGPARAVAPIANFTPLFTIRIGKVNEHTDLYAKRMTEDDTHPLHLENLQAFADGLFVSLDGYRMTLKPLHGILKRSQYLPYLAKTRVHLKIHDLSTKANFIDAAAHKDASTLQKIRDGRGNPLNVALDAVCSLLSKALKGKKDPLMKDDLFKELTRAPAARRARVTHAVNDGHTYEVNCVDHLRAAFGDMVIGNDVAIRRDVLGTTDKQYSGIDILLQTDHGVLIAIQCKRKERVSENDYESFVRTLKYARTKFASDYVHGLFVAQNPPDMNTNLREFLATPSVQLLVIPDANLGDIVAHVTAILQFYGLD